MKFVFLIILTIYLLSKCEAQKQTFCSRCSCSQWNETFLEVFCQADVADLLHSAEAGDFQKPVYKMIIRKNKLVEINYQFPWGSLVELDLSDNKIWHIEDKVFQKLQKLETLILSFNNMMQLNPNVFEGEYLAGKFEPMRSLKNLYLDNNNLHTLNEDVFEHTPAIEVLSLAFNPLTVITTQTAIAITNLPQLKVLDLSDTKISVLPSHFLHTPKFLRVLNLSGNAFDEVPRGLEEAQSLDTLIFSGNPLTNLSQNYSFPKITTLRVLHLCEMPQLVTIGPGSMSNLTNLEELYVASNPRLVRIDDAALVDTNKIDTYKVWPRIRKLYLNDNQLSYLNKTLLAHWDTLSELDLLGNPWACECENQWMVDTLIPIYTKIDAERAKQLRCAAPVEMADYTFEQLNKKNYYMRCLDYYGARPERDAIILVGIFAGMLLGIPLVLAILYAYKRHWFGIFDDSPAAFSRQFYNRTKSNDIYEY